jgi:hypothetical protein
LLFFLICYSKLLGHIYIHYKHFLHLFFYCIQLYPHQNL